MPRSAIIERRTKETEIRLELELDGVGAAALDTGLPFLDHMLSHVARHGGLDLEIEARGDLEVDGHHTVEDVGICLGQALAQALGRREGIERFGEAVVPMDEALCRVVLDLGGRPCLVYRVELPKAKVGGFDVELARGFFGAFSVHALANVHVEVFYGENMHHILEGIFKAFGRALRAAVETGRRPGGEPPSTKGVIV